MVIMAQGGVALYNPRTVCRKYFDNIEAYMTRFFFYLPKKSLHRVCANPTSIGRDSVPPVSTGSTIPATGIKKWITSKAKKLLGLPTIQNNAVKPDTTLNSIQYSAGVVRKHNALFPNKLGNSTESGSTGVIGNNLSRRNNIETEQEMMQKLSELPVVLDCLVSLYDLYYIGRNKKLQSFDRDIQKKFEEVRDKEEIICRDITKIRVLLAALLDQDVYVACHSFTQDWVKFGQADAMYNYIIQYAEKYQDTICADPAGILYGQIKAFNVCVDMMLNLCILVEKEVSLLNKFSSSLEEGMLKNSIATYYYLCSLIIEAYKELCTGYDRMHEMCCDNTKDNNTHMDDSREYGANIMGENTLACGSYSKNY